jgi:hypothetical protein
MKTVKRVIMLGKKKRENVLKQEFRKMLGATCDVYFLHRYRLKGISVVMKNTTNYSLVVLNFALALKC